MRDRNINYNLKENKNQRIGTHMINHNGFGATCVDYKNCMEILIQFDDYNATHICTWQSFMNSQFKDPPWHIGERKQNSDGSWMEIIDYYNASNITVKFDTGFIATNKEYAAFRHGYIEDPLFPIVCGVGYYGIGDYVAYKNYKTTQAYSRWHGILQRCYTKQDDDHSSYKDCTICDEWLNYQNFAKWYEDNYYVIPGHKMDVDKDIIHKKNKIYSPDTCCIVPRIVNQTFIKLNSDQRKYPLGVKATHNKIPKYVATIKKEGERCHLGTFDTPEEAFYAYKAAKEAHIKQMADKYKQWLPDKVYQAMYAYEIDIND